MPRYTTSQTFTDGNTQIVALPDPAEKKDVGAEKDPEAEELELKLQRITEQVPARISNTSGSSAGSGSGDFHQYRQMRRHEQDRMMRMEVDYTKRKDQREFEQRRLERERAAEERTAKKRAKRLKKKEKKKTKSSGGLTSIAEGKENGDEGEGESESEKEDEVPQDELD